MDLDTALEIAGMAECMDLWPEPQGAEGRARQAVMRISVALRLTEAREAIAAAGIA